MPDSKSHIALIDDDKDLCLLLQKWLEIAKAHVDIFHSIKDFEMGRENKSYAVICLDLGLPDAKNLEALLAVRRLSPEVPVVVLTGDKRVNTVVEAMHEGAFEYLSKPPDKDKLQRAVTKAIASQELTHKIHGFSDEKDPYFIHGRSEVIERLRRRIQKVSASDITVLIHGESGSGKELVARSIHNSSSRRNGPWIALNCAAISESLQDSELFGHEKGAFTGADKQKPGKFELADGGTLFLDEIAELSPSLQAKLLRVLQERSFERVGGTKSLKSDFRLIAASHRDLSDMVEHDQFRRDLYYRLAVMELDIPPLREREGDVDVLMEVLLTKIAKVLGGAMFQIEGAALKAMRTYSWPGNVRELDNALKRATVMADEAMITIDDLPKRLKAESKHVQLDASTIGQAPEELTLAELERWAILRCLEQHKGQLAVVAKKLGIGRTTLYRKLKLYGAIGEDTPPNRSN